MASSFNTSVAALEDELMTLILDGKIQARIDSHNKVCDFCKIDNCLHELYYIFNHFKTLCIFLGPLCSRYRPAKCNV